MIAAVVPKKITGFANFKHIEHSVARGRGFHTRYLYHIKDEDECDREIFLKRVKDAGGKVFKAPSLADVRSQVSTILLSPSTFPTDA